MKNLITKSDLENAKKVLNQMKKERTFPHIFKGDIPVLFTAREILPNNLTKEKFMDILAHNPEDELAKKALNYSLYEDYLLAILYLLHQSLGCSVIFTSFSPSQDYSQWLTDLTPILEFYQNPDLVAFIKKNKTQTLTNIIIRDYPNHLKQVPPRLVTTEYHSSFNYLGLTNFSTSIINIANSHNFKTIGDYQSAPNLQDFASTASVFTDDIIKCYQALKINIGDIQNKELTPNQIWPYTLEAKFTICTENHLDQLIAIYNILQEHILFTQEQIQQKGLTRALIIPKN